MPLYGGFALLYAGNKVKAPYWSLLGVGFVLGSFIFVTTEWIFGVWLAQITSAFYFRKHFIIATASPRQLQVEKANIQLVREMARIRGKVDLNSGSQDELVYQLGLPIVYANKILALRREGYVFTRLSELVEVAEIPESYLPRLEPLITVAPEKSDRSRKNPLHHLNTFSLGELIDCGTDPKVAERLIEERERRGIYHSPAEVWRRTRIATSAYRHLLKN